MKRPLDLLWLLLLGVFIFLGMPLASFHGDETYHIYTSNDYATLFINHRPQDLIVHSLWESDQGYLRIMNGGFTRYAIGLTWHLAGLTQEQLPDSGYLYGENYDDNLGRGLVPPAGLLNVYRIPSTLFTALSVVVVFVLGKLYGGRPLAYFVSAIYALNPIILLNGRRAMQESPLLFFGVLTIYLALVIAQKLETRTPVQPHWWWGLIIIGILTLLSKHQGVVYVAAAYATIFISEALHRHNILPVTGRLVGCGMVTVLLCFVLMPALWYDPVARVNDIIQGRSGLMQTQVDLDPNAPTTMEQRVFDMIRVPYLMPPQHYELQPVRYSVEQDRQIYEYMRSPLSGLQFGIALGGALTLFAWFGLVVNAVPRLRIHSSRALAIGLYVYVAANVATLMTNPLPWQRYFLSEFPVVSLLSGVGFFSLFHRIKLVQPHHA